MSASSAACNASGVKRSGVTAGLEQIAVLPQQIAPTRERVDIAVVHDVPKPGAARRSPAMVLLTVASVAGSAPSIASRISRDTTPSRS